MKIGKFVIIITLVIAIMIGYMPLNAVANETGESAANASETSNLDNIDTPKPSETPKQPEPATPYYPQYYQQYETPAPTPKQREAAPMVHIEGDGLGTLKPNQEFKVTIYVKNVGRTTMKNTVAVFNPSDSLMLIENSSSQVLSDLSPGRKVKIELKMRVLDNVSSPSQFIQVDLKYNYTSGDDQMSDSSSGKVPVYITLPDSVSPPLMQIIRGDIGTIHEGEEFALSIQVKNAGKTTIEAPFVEFAPSDSLMLVSKSSSQLLQDLPEGGSQTIELKLKAADLISSTPQHISIEAKYSYKEGKEVKSGSLSDKITIPVAIKPEVTSPRIQILKEDMDIVQPGQSFQMKLHVKNIGKTLMESPVISFAPSESLIITDKAATFTLPELAEGDMAEVILNLQAAQDIRAQIQSLEASVKFHYMDKNQIKESTHSEKISILAKAKDKDNELKSSTPYIIVENYGFGSQQVAAGSIFELDITFNNTNRSKAIENIVFSLEPGEGLSVNSSGNTYYYKSLGAGASQSERIQILALPTAKTGSAKIELSFKYEFVEGNNRNSVSSNQNINIPIYQMDRFEVSPMPVTETAFAGSEFTLSLAYINKGKSDVSNVKAEIVGDIPSIAKIQNLGNFESGKNGNIGFVVNPENEGSYDFNLKITYEDPNTVEKTLEFPVSLNVLSPPVEDNFEDFEWPEEPDNTSTVYFIFLVAALAIIVMAVVKIRANKRKKKSESSSVEWEYDESDEFASNAFENESREERHI